MRACLALVALFAASAQGFVVMPPVSGVVSPALASSRGLAQLHPEVRRVPAASMAAGDKEGLAPAVGYAYVGLLAASVLLAASATSTGSPPNGLLIVTVAFTVATALANVLVKDD